VTNTREESPGVETSARADPAPADAEQQTTGDALDDALRMTFPASDPVAIDASQHEAGERPKRGLRSRPYRQP
jgi:hypothetical protein